MLTLVKMVKMGTNENWDDQHDHDGQSLAHGRPGVVDDDLAQVDGVDDDKSSPGTAENLTK